MDMSKYTFEPGQDVLVRDSLGEKWYRQQFVGTTQETNKYGTLTFAVTRVEGYSGTLRHLFCIPLNEKTAHLEGTAISACTLEPPARSPQADWTGTLEQQIFDDRALLFQDSPVAEMLYTLAINVGMYEQARKKGAGLTEETAHLIGAMHARLGEHVRKAHKMLLDIRFSDIDKDTPCAPLEYLRLGNHVAEDMYRGKSVDPDDVRLFKAATQLQEARADIMELTSTVKVLLNTIQSMGK